MDVNRAHTESACKCEDYTACGMLGGNIVIKEDK